jgi:signal-transduction protein with cAMP-binding, CBS, and nucleotidyltransferase domain
MMPCATTLPEDAPVHKAINLLLHGRNLTIAVVDAVGQFRGALAEHDLTQVVCFPQKWSHPIHEFMASNFVTFDESDDASDVYDYLSRGSVQRAFVLQNDCPVGIVSMASLMRWIEQNTDSTNGTDLTAANPAAVHSLADRILEETQRLQAELETASNSAPLDPDAADKIQALAASLLDVCQLPETL